MPSAIFRPGDRPLLNFGLVGLTLVTTCLSFYWMFPDAQDHGDFPGAVSFALALVLILGSHEMGHYLLARVHDVDTSLPYFIPLPFVGFGTLGAVIRIRGRIPTLNALADIGAAGPIAGLVVAIPLLAIGISQSTLVPAAPQHELFLGSLSGIAVLRHLFEYAHAWLVGHPIPWSTGTSANTIFGDNLLTLAMQRLILGPLPPGKDLVATPLFLAAWVGLLITMLNLCPIGQLDGGHVAYAFFGKRAVWVGKAAALLLVALTLFGSVTWLLWLLIATKVVGYRHPPVEYEGVPLSPGRKIVSVVCFIAFVVCLIPVPMMLVTSP
jgi:membrane-associated protease RseP (regulator of RpoE activity)